MSQFGPLSLLPSIKLAISVTFFTKIINLCHLSFMIGEQGLDFKSAHKDTIDSMIISIIISFLS